MQLRDIPTRYIEKVDKQLLKIAKLKIELEKAEEEYQLIVRMIKEWEVMSKCQSLNVNSGL